MNKVEMEAAWNGKVIDSAKINRFKQGKTNHYKCTMTVLEERTLDTITESGYYKTMGEAKIALERKLREIRDEKYPHADYPKIKWSFRLSE